MGQLFKDAFLRAVSQRDGVDKTTVSSKNLTAVVLCNDVLATKKKSSNCVVGQLHVEQIEIGLHADTTASEALVTKVISSASYKDSVAKQDPLPNSNSKNKSVVPRAERGGPRFSSEQWLKNYKHPSAAVFNRPFSTPRYPHLTTPRPEPKTFTDQVTISIAANATVSWPGVLNGDADLLPVDEHAGIAVQCHAGKFSTTRELVIGLDFGTSCVKVVITDPALEQTFAVPFRDLVGVNSYLLPSRLHEENDRFSLRSAGASNGRQIHRDLKLALLANAFNKDVCRRVTGFFALLIRRVRAWFFDKQGPAYWNVEILWKLVLGLPAESTENISLVSLYKNLGLAAWHAAGQTGAITRSLCDRSEASALKGALGDEVEVCVMPELAAQIQGFLSSDQFDLKACNLYMIADVGAGTVDSCLLHVTKAANGGFIYDLHTTVVEPRGVMNLHRHRMDWWLKNLVHVKNAERLTGMLEDLRMPTEQLTPLPESFEGYFSGVSTSFSGKERSPDASFREDLFTQLQGKTAYRAFRDGKLEQSDISTARSILCGGGSRMAYYQALSKDLEIKPNGFSWLTMQPMALVLPRNLKAAGVPDNDFDRLSVAYGLSTMNLEAVRKMQPRARAIKTQPESTQTYIHHLY